MLLVVAIGLSGVGSGSSDAEPAGSSVRTSRSVAATALPKCPRVLAAVRFYSGRIAEHRAKLRAGRGTPRASESGTGLAAATAARPSRDARGRPVAARPQACPRYLAHVLQRKARELRLYVERYLAYHYGWRVWLPDVWQRLGACETGYGRRPGDWSWDSGTYVSAFGIYRAGYADDAHRIGALSWDETIARLGRLPTPREQYRAALSHYNAHGGFSGWGCRGA